MVIRETHMQFTVPQFIEKPAKIVGPFTFKQFIFIGTAGGLCLFLYFTVPFSVFVIAAILLIGGAFALVFLKIGNISLPVFIKNFFVFLFKPKIFLWEKKITPPRFFQQKKVKIIEEIKKDKEPTLKIGEGSRLKELFTYLETK